MYWTFIAISHVARRVILERLHADNGQSVSKLASQTTYTRQAIAKHMEVLEESEVVVSKRVGRERLYFIKSPLLIEHLDTWLERFRPPTAGATSPAEVTKAARKKRAYDPKRNPNSAGQRALKRIEGESPGR